MASLKDQIIASSYHKLLQKSASGVLADGLGNAITLNINGSDTYTSGSVNTKKALTVTGSIIPEGDAKWDLGSEDNPFRDLYITSASLVFIKPGMAEAKKLPGFKREKYVTTLTQKSVDDLLSGKTIQRIDKVTKEKIVPKEIIAAESIPTQAFTYDSNRDLMPLKETRLDNAIWELTNNGEDLSLKRNNFKYAFIGTDGNFDDIIVD